MSTRTASRWLRHWTPLHIQRYQAETAGDLDWLADVEAAEAIAESDRVAAARAEWASAQQTAKHDLEAARAASDREIEDAMRDVLGTLHRDGIASIPSRPTPAAAAAILALLRCGTVTAGDGTLALAAQFAHLDADLLLHMCAEYPSDVTDLDSCRTAALETDR